MSSFEKQINETFRKDDSKLLKTGPTQRRDMVGLAYWLDKNSGVIIGIINFSFFEIALIFALFFNKKLQFPFNI